MYKDAKDKGVSGENISTVGVDIGDLTVVREGKTVVFHTWDFGGQVRVFLHKPHYNITLSTSYFHQIVMIINCCCMY